MLPLIAMFVFVAVAVGIFALALAAYAPSSVLSERLRALEVEDTPARQKSGFRERMGPVLAPLGLALHLSPGARSRRCLCPAVFRAPRHPVGSRGRTRAGAAARCLT